MRSREWMLLWPHSHCVRCATEAARVLVHIIYTLVCTATTTRFSRYYTPRATRCCRLYYQQQQKQWPHFTSALSFSLSLSVVTPLCSQLRHCIAGGRNRLFTAHFTSFYTLSLVYFWCIYIHSSWKIQTYMFSKSNYVQRAWTVMGICRKNEVRCS